jgi:predicted N-acetyltransferase YhbS
MANEPLCSRLLSQLSEERLTSSTGGSEITIRAALKSDVVHVTDLVHRSFQVWAQKGLNLSPTVQTETETALHLLDKGFVATDIRNRILGTFSVDMGQIERTAPDELTYHEGEESITFHSISKVELRSGKYLVFKKLAVDPSIGRLGLGLNLYQTAETMARTNGYVGMVIETVKEATWLYEWYQKLGFSTVGSHRYSGSQVDTLLMIKNF